MTYTIYNLNTCKENTLDIKNGVITNNFAKYVLKNGRITRFDRDENGNFRSKGRQVSHIELTNNHCELINGLSAEDGNSSRFDENDLKDLNSENLQQKIAETLNNDSIYNYKSANVDEFVLNAKYNNINSETEDNLTIEFEKPLPWYKRAWNSIKSFFGIAKNESEKEETVTEKFEKRPVDLEKAFNENIKIKPSFEYTIKRGDRLNVLANDFGVSVDRILSANEDKNLMTELKAGEKITIPSAIVVKSGVINNIEDIERVTGISEQYIKNILFDIEGRNSEPDLTPKYDNVATPTNPKGVLTIGFGHTGRVHGVVMTSKNMNDIHITKQEAYEILAQDILNAKADAIDYFGQDFLDAPLSVQDGIIDILFNKGIERGLEGVQRDKKGNIKDENLNSLTKFLKEDLKNKDYVSAVEHMIYNTPLLGLKKRNIYRIIEGMKSLSYDDRQAIVDRTQHYYETTLAGYKNSERNKIKNDWETAVHMEEYCTD